MTRIWTVSLSMLVALVVVLAPAAAPDRKPPRIVAAAMIDVDNDARTDRIRLSYSEPVRHVADRDGRYPFIVSGYRVRSIGKASGRALVIVLVEPAEPDPTATPIVRYRRTLRQPVKDRAGNQAVAQPSARTKPHGHTPPTPPGTPPAPTPLDTDGDGTLDANDCAPKDATIHPGAPDIPDLAFVDSNCDGIDGTEKDAVFVAPNGNDANPGTKAKPKLELQAAIATILAGNGRYVLVAFGTYARVRVASGIGIYGGYDPSSWKRLDRYPDGLTLISGSPEGVLIDGAKDVVLQQLKIRGIAPAAGSRSAYGIHAIRGASLTLQRVVVSAGNGSSAPAGSNGPAGERGGAGAPGGGSACDDGPIGVGGKGGTSPAGRTGGSGGSGGFEGLNHKEGGPGEEGKIGTAGGPGGKAGNPGKPGGRGDSGKNGTAGVPGAGASSSLASASVVWVGATGGSGGTGTPGNGGGGGGGGGPQVGLFADNSNGNGGGGGGGGGAPGTRGGGGDYGGGSFGLYLLNSKVVIEDSTIAAGNGGAGGRGGSGGFGGPGGIGGLGGKVCTSEVGAGGNGGFGGVGGRGGGGGGGEGGPSLGIFKVGTSTATVKESKVTAGTPGAGGAGGSSGPGGTGLAGAGGIAKAVFP